MTVAGSPGDSRRIMNTTNATTSITGMVASARRPMNIHMIGIASARSRAECTMGVPGRSLSTARAAASGNHPGRRCVRSDRHVPEELHRRFDHALDVLAVAAGHEEGADIGMGADLDRPLLDPATQRLLLLDAGGEGELVAQLLHLGVARLAEPRLVAAARQEIGRAHV